MVTSTWRPTSAAFRARCKHCKNFPEIWSFSFNIKYGKNLRKDIDRAFNKVCYEIKKNRIKYLYMDYIPLNKYNKLGGLNSLTSHVSVSVGIHRTSRLDAYLQNIIIDQISCRCSQSTWIYKNGEEGHLSNNKRLKLTLPLK